MGCEPCPAVSAVLVEVLCMPAQSYSNQPYYRSGHLLRHKYGLSLAFVRFAIDLVNFGEYSDPHVLDELARAAEDAG
jgi:hypothetical protein